jgi:hypothetical protein
MCFMCKETQCLYCYISFCLTKRHDNSCNTITFTDILLYFLLQQQFLDNITKAGVKVNIFIMYQKNLLLFFLELKVVVFLYVSHRDPKQIPGKPPLTYTVYMSTKIHYLQYILTTKRGSYSKSVYSYIQNRLVSNFM